MRTKNFAKTALIAAIASGLLLVHTGAPAQATMTLPRAATMMRADGPTMQEQMNQMAAKIAALETRLAADEKKLHDVSDAADQAKTGIGFINLGMGKQLNDLQGSVGPYQNNTNGVIAGLGQQLGALKGRFDSHTHTFHSAVIGLHPDNTVSTLSYPAQTTSPPNN